MIGERKIRQNPAVEAKLQEPHPPTIRSGLRPGPCSRKLPQCPSRLWPPLSLPWFQTEPWSCPRWEAFDTENHLRPRHITGHLLGKGCMQGRWPPSGWGRMTQRCVPQDGFGRTGCPGTQQGRVTLRPPSEATRASRELPRPESWEEEGHLWAASLSHPSEKNTSATTEGNGSGGDRLPPSGLAFVPSLLTVFHPWTRLRVAQTSSGVSRGNGRKSRPSPLLPRCGRVGT